MRKGGGECIDLVSRRNPIAVGAGRRKRSVSVVYDVWPIPAPCFRAGGRASREAFPGSYFRSGPDVGPSVVSVHAGAGGGDGRTGKSVGTALDGAALGLFRFPVFVFPARRSCRGGILWAIRSGALLWSGQRSCGAEVVAVFRYFVVGRGFERRAV